MILLVFSILLLVSPSLGAPEPPDPQSKTLNHSTPVPKLLKDSTIGKKDDALLESEGNDYSDYIVGGKDVSSKCNFGYQALVELHKKRSPPGSYYMCGGTVIHPRFIITAAHCLYDEDKNKMTLSNTRFQVVVGEHDKCDALDPDYRGGQKFLVSQVFEHEDYDKYKNDNDIAILKLPRDIIFNAQVWPACLPASITKGYTGKSVKVSGWGQTKGYDNVEQRPENEEVCKLKETTLKITAYNDSRCSDILGSKQPDPRRLCAYAPNTDTCQGDSGGPLAIKEGNRYVLLGVTSYGEGCAHSSGLAGVYARVQGFLPWIKRVLLPAVADTEVCGSAQTSATNTG